MKPEDIKKLPTPETDAAVIHLDERHSPGAYDVVGLSVSSSLEQRLAAAEDRLHISTIYIESLLAGGQPDPIDLHDLRLGNRETLAAIKELSDHHG